MKKLISKSVLFAFFCMLVLPSCESDSPGDKDVTVVEKYRIVVNNSSDSKLGSDSPGLNALADFAKAEIAKINKDYGKSEWTITVKAKTEEAGKIEADKKAKEIFTSMLPKLNEAVASLKVKLEAKRAELAADIVKENKYRLKYAVINSFLFKEIHADTNDYWDIISEGTSVSFEAIGGTQY